MASRDSFIDNIDIPDSQRRKVEERRREQGFRGGSGGSSIRRETQAEKQTRLRQQRLEDLQSELSSTGSRLTPEEAQAILEGKSVDQVRSQIVQRQRKEDLQSLQSELSQTGEKLKPSEVQSILGGASVNSIRDQVFTRAQRKQLQEQREQKVVEAQKAAAVQTVRQRQIANNLLKKQEKAKNQEQEVGGVVRSMQEVREERLEVLSQQFQDVGFNKKAADNLAVVELGREKLDEGVVLSSKTPDLLSQVGRRTKDIVASTGADFLLTTTALLQDPKTTGQLALNLVGELRRNPKKVLSDVRTEAERNPLTATIDIVTLGRGGASLADDVIGGSLDALDNTLPLSRTEAQARAAAAGARAKGRVAAVDEVVQEVTGLNKNRRAQVKNPNKRTKSKAQIRKESLNQNFNPNVNIDPNKVTAKTGRARKSRKSIEAVDPNTVRVVDDKRGARTGFGTPQDKTTATFRNVDGQRSIDVQKEVGFVQGQAQELGGKGFSRPASQVQVPKGFDPKVQAVDVGNQKIIAEQLLVQKQQSRGPAFDVPKRQPRKQQDPTFVNPANADNNQLQVLSKPDVDVEKQPRATKRGTKPASKRQARFQARKERLGKRRKESKQVDLFEEKQRSPDFSGSAGLFSDLDTLAEIQSFGQSLVSNRQQLVEAINTASVRAPALRGRVSTDFEQANIQSVSEKQKSRVEPTVKPSLVVSNEVDVSSKSRISSLQDVDTQPRFDVAQNSIIDTDEVTKKPTTQKPRTDTPRPPTPSLVRDPVQPRKTPDTPTPKRPPVIPDPNFRVPRIPLGKKNKVNIPEPKFRVVVGRKGNKVFQDLGVGGVELIQSGKKRVQQTAAATLQVIPINSRIPKSQIKGLLGKDFSESKSLDDGFIQKRNRRISTKGEKEDITSFGKKKGKRTNILESNKQSELALGLVNSGKPLRSVRDIL